jgi:serine/threonine-protein kinase RsbW
VVDGFCAHCGAGDAVSFAVRLVAEELFTNFVKYNRGGGDHVLMELEIQNGVIALSLTDFDVEPFDVTQTPDVDVGAPVEQRQPGGLGLHLVKAYTDEFRYEYHDRTMKVTATKRLEADDV